VDPRLAALTLRQQHDRVMAHLALTRGDGIVVGVENVVEESDDEAGLAKADPLHGVPKIQTIIKYPTPREVSEPPTSPVASEPAATAPRPRRHILSDSSTDDSGSGSDNEAGEFKGVDVAVDMDGDGDANVNMGQGMDMDTPASVGVGGGGGGGGGGGSPNNHGDDGVHVATVHVGGRASHSRRSTVSFRDPPTQGDCDTAAQHGGGATIVARSTTPSSPTGGRGDEQDDSAAAGGGLSETQREKLKLDFTQLRGGAKFRRPPTGASHVSAASGGTLTVASVCVQSTWGVWIPKRELALWACRVVAQHHGAKRTLTLLPMLVPTTTAAHSVSTTAAVVPPSSKATGSQRTRGGTPHGSIAGTASNGGGPAGQRGAMVPSNGPRPFVTKSGKVIHFTKTGKVAWKWDDPVEIPPDYEPPRVATARFQGQVVRALLREGRGEWQVLQEPDTGKLLFRNNITLEKLDRPPEGVDLFGGMAALTYLDLGHNKLVQIPESVATLRDLEVGWVFCCGLFVCSFFLFWACGWTLLVVACDT